MGYYSTASGSIEINPPLNSRELREMRDLPDIDQPYGEEIEVVVTEERQRTMTDPRLSGGQVQGLSRRALTKTGSGTIRTSSFRLW